MSVEGKAAARRDEYRSQYKNIVGCMPGSHSGLEWFDNRMSLLMQCFPRSIALMINIDAMESEKIAMQREIDWQVDKVNDLLGKRVRKMAKCRRLGATVYIPIEGSAEDMRLNVEWTAAHEAIGTLKDYHDLLLEWVEEWMYKLRAASQRADLLQWELHKIQYIINLAHLG